MGHLAISRDIVVVVTGCCGDAISFQWVEARDATKPPIMYRTAPTTKNYLVPSVNSAESEKPALDQELKLG